MGFEWDDTDQPKMVGMLSSSRVLLHIYPNQWIGREIALDGQPKVDALHYC